MKRKYVINCTGGNKLSRSGERGIRTPGGVTLNGFQDRRIRPLCHLSGANVRFGIYSKNKMGYFFENNFSRNIYFGR